MSNSTKTRTKRKSKGPKPSKPYPDFPLFAHANGQWCKTIRGKQIHFGVWADRDAALQKYVDQRDDLQAGRTPRVQGDGLTVSHLCNHFLTAKQDAMDAGELANRSFLDLVRVCKFVIEAFGKTRLVEDLAANDFASLRKRFAATLGPVALASQIQRVRSIFKFATENALTEQPVCKRRSKPLALESEVRVKP